MSEEVGYDLESAKISLGYAQEWVELAKGTVGDRLDGYTGYLCYPDGTFVVCVALNEGKVAGVVPVLLGHADEFINIFSNALEQAEGINSMFPEDENDEAGG